ncbi:MAG: type I-C CRISPR-associated endonuclease Cas1c [Kiritimatiellae bacterium]|jgi:CRISPR-associated protein Cas1|nr:type I-C CRISPR-associated endonuclease Cas1c [Kiritimatiellia bacterium]
MKRILNTLYIRTQGAYLKKEGESVVVQIEKETKLRVPLLSLCSIVTFGNVLCSPFLLGSCAKHGLSVSMLSEHGYYLGHFDGPVSGNVLLRRTQYRWADDVEKTRSVVRSIVAGKIVNARQVLLRTARERPDDEDLKNAVAHLKGSIGRLGGTALDSDKMRGIEGDAAKVYFSVFNKMITVDKEEFVFNGRSRRPPMDRINALLSFAYTLLYNEMKGALASVGLDPSVGFLHRDRPGRHSLALDMMEEMRTFWADRLALTLVNRQQLSVKDFDVSDSGSVLLNDKGRKTVLVAWQKRKQDEITHPFTNDRIHLGLLPFLQAQILARYMRGDLDAYPPFFWR